MTTVLTNLLSGSGEPARSIAEQLFERIQAKAYGTGARLPAERLLAEEFGVTRSAVRDALDLLVRGKVVARRAGAGNFIVYRPDAMPAAEPIAANDQGSVAEQTSLLELQVVRGIVEPEIVRLAVIHMKPRDIERLRRILARMEPVETDAEEFARAEEDFLLQIAHGTGNPLLIAIYEQIAAVRREPHWIAHKRKALSPRRIRTTKSRHRSMFEAIERRDLETAVEYVKLQLVDEQRALMAEE